MNRMINKWYFILLVATLASVTACEVEEIVDPNNPSLGSVLNDASKAELQTLVYGLEGRNRDYLANAVQMFGAFGREVWPYFASDPRFIPDWLGIGRTETYTDFFTSGGTYVTPYIAVKQANVLIQSADNSTALSTAERAGYKGFAKTIKGFQLLWPLMQQYQNGIRIEVSDPLNPGPRLGYAESLAAISDILADGLKDLNDAGSSFSFVLTEGFGGFDTPDGMKKVNRAIAARVALYAGNNQGALDALAVSFMDLDVDAATSDKMNVGPAHVYGEAPDLNNPLYYPFDRPTSTILIAHPALIEDALPGDARVANKFARRVANPVTNNALKDAAGNLLVGEYQDNRWATNTDPVPFIRNEELILIYAEAKARSGQPTDAVEAINVVRNTWGLANYGGAQTEDALIDEILFQRRYSLWAEGGHRWIDLRRTNRLNSTYVDLRDLGSIYTQVSRRSSEINWDEG
ncbi:MAG: RagB/SusD family nutrient uptake outer membrane protein [Saprospiraceae bacterium]|nr:RagB/SusD family nutrient uptake outer membrane protein [Saprospiraceae bacterium]MDZ4703995.1 RagB/SusD family nutrient uptake outer membrane protein [Saprospiraceae bacterium]